MPKSALVKGFGCRQGYESLSHKPWVNIAHVPNTLVVFPYQEVCTHDALTTKTDSKIRRTDIRATSLFRSPIQSLFYVQATEMRGPP